MLSISFHGLILKNKTKESKPGGHSNNLLLHPCILYKKKKFAEGPTISCTELPSRRQILLENTIRQQIKLREGKEGNALKQENQSWILLQDYTNTGVSLLACHYESSGRHQTHTKKNYASLLTANIKTAYLASCKLPTEPLYQRDTLI